MAFDERAFFTEKSENRPGQYQCPKCRRTNEYSIRWVRRSKKDRLPPGANEEDRAKFSKRLHLQGLDRRNCRIACAREDEPERAM